jgi:hypothetical protein
MDGDRDIAYSIAVVGIFLIVWFNWLGPWLFRLLLG